MFFSPDDWLIVVENSFSMYGSNAHVASPYISLYMMLTVITPHESHEHVYWALTPVLATSAFLRGKKYTLWVCPGSIMPMPLSGSVDYHRTPCKHCGKKQHHDIAMRHHCIAFPIRKT